MAIQIVHDYELGDGLHYNNSKVEVKPDNTGNVKFEVSEQGLKGNVELPAEFDATEINNKLQQAEKKAQELQTALDTEKGKVATLENKVKALEERKDLHATGLRLDDATNEVVLTVDGGAELRVALGKFLNIVPSATEVYEEVKDQILADVKEALKGEEVKDLAQSLKGYLLKV